MTEYMMHMFHHHLISYFKPSRTCWRRGPVQFLHLPYQALSTHDAAGAMVVVAVLVTVVVGLGSTQMKPNHSLEWHLEVLERADDIVVDIEPVGRGVVEVSRADVATTVEVVVTVGTGAAVADDLSRETVAVTSVESLQPNQPGVLQVAVEELEVEVVFEVVVVVSSRQPHQPGVLQVVVRVFVVEVEELDVVVELELLLSKYAQLKQSVQSGYGSHFGGLSYFKITSCMTLLMR